MELKHDLVKWNPPNPDVRTVPESNFPWEYVNLDDLLVDLKLPPSLLEVPVPKYFMEDHAAEIKKRDRLVRGYMELKLGVPALYVDDLEAHVAMADAVGEYYHMIIYIYIYICHRCRYRARRSFDQYFKYI